MRYCNFGVSPINYSDSDSETDQIMFERFVGWFYSVDHLGFGFYPQEDVGNLALIKEKFSFYLLLFIV